MNRYSKSQKLSNNHKLLGNLKYDKIHKLLCNLKSQAALEFLTTYGWAFLVILIMIGTLAYFGILSPGRLLPDRCNFGAEISCDKNRMVIHNVEDNTLDMQLTNNFGVGVIITSGTITTDVDAVGICTAQINDVDISDYSWGSGKIITLNADCDDSDPNIGGDQLTENELVKFQIELKYYAATASSIYTKTIFGEALTTIQ